jgi:hypothetical protein
MIPKIKHVKPKNWKILEIPMIDAKPISSARIGVVPAVGIGAKDIITIPWKVLLSS